MSRVLTAAVLAAASLSAQAAADGKRTDVWQRAIDPVTTETAIDLYQRSLRDGDDHVLQASSRSSSVAAIRDQVQRAIDAYRGAATAQPSAAEPYFRIGMVLWSFYLQNCDHDPRYGHTRSPLADCSAPDAINPGIAEQTIKAWDAFEARAPLDPRLSGGPGSLLFSRAIIHTKLATRAHLEAAARDYEAIIHRSDGRGDTLSLVWGNLAETYMMVGRLDDSIAAYREAIRYGARTATWYGLAVALDRDGRATLAHDVMVAQGAAGYRAFEGDVESRSTFFVPRGEVFYYFALAEEALGQLDEALDHWNKYIASGAHPQYQPRAREHVDALLARRRAGLGPPRSAVDLLRSDPLP
jgi:tetratricopeptide (TPR) repeat protein